MDAAELKALFSGADQPVLTAVRWAETAGGDRPEFPAVVLEMFAQQGRISDATVLRGLFRSARAWAERHSAGVATLAETLSRVDSPAALAFGAALLETTRNTQRAAAMLEALAERTSGEVRALCLLGRAQNCHQAGRQAEAVHALADAVKASDSARTLANADTLLRQLMQAGEVACRRKCRVAVVGSFTLEFLIPALRTECFSGGVQAEIWVGRYGQYVQEILDPGSELGTFKPDIVVVASEWRALGLAEEIDHPAEVVHAKVAGFRGLWAACLERLHAHVIQFNFEVPAHGPYGRLSAALPGGMGRVIREINQAFFETENTLPGLTILDIDQLAGCVGKTGWNDEALWHTAKQYPAPSALPVLARNLTAVIRGILGLTAKCLVLDLDGTLWGGVIGEDGLGNIKLGGEPAGDAYVAFQKYVLGLKRRGILLAVCSKNDEADARQPFASHPEMVLKAEDISLFVANWKSKDENLRYIAQSLNIGLDSLVFVDDSPIERRWIRRQLPEVHVVELPEDPARFIEALERHRPFEALVLSEEDRQRVTSYRGNQERETLRASSSTVAEFLAGLEMVVELRPFDEPNLPRIAQLINKTNQFNVTTRRLTEGQVAGLIGAKGIYTQAMRLRDRFGDYGLTGALIGRADGSSLRIEVWLMSCRVLGRLVENAVMAGLMRTARAAGFTRLIGEYVPSAKNSVVKDIYPRLGFQVWEQAGASHHCYVWELSRVPLEVPVGMKLSSGTWESALLTDPKPH